MILPQVHLRNGEYSCEKAWASLAPPEGGTDYILSRCDLQQPVAI